MPRETETLSLLKTLLGLYKPSGGEVCRLAEVAKLNKLLLAYLRSVGDVLRDELVREEARYKWFMRNVAEVVDALNRAGVRYALHKFRRPFDHVSVDLDILVKVDDIPKAVKTFISRGFRVVVLEPYTITLARNGFIVDLYTNPSFAWVVYMDGEALLRCCVEEVEVGGVRAGALTRGAEVAVAAAHAVYKEHMVLLIDCLVAWSWLSGEAWGVAVEHRVEGALEALLGACSLIREGYAEAPRRLGPHAVLGALARKVVRDPLLRGTLPNALRYLARGDAGRRVLARLTRESY
jgi:hypothetical protein